MNYKRMSMYDFLYTLVLISFMTAFLNQAEIHEENKKLFKSLLVMKSISQLISIKLMSKVQ